MEDACSGSHCGEGGGGIRGGRFGKRGSCVAWGQFLKSGFRLLTICSEITSVLRISQTTGV